jgi:hypothetical protein
MTNSQNGFVALISCIIISALLLLLVTGISATSYAFSESVLDQQASLSARAHAYGCAQLVLLRLASDEQYEGGQTFQVHTAVCAVGSITRLSSNSAEFTVSVAERGATVHRKVDIGLSPLVLTSLVELAAVE